MMYHNNLTRGYGTHINQPISFMNNQMFTNNPLYASNIQDQSFFQRMMSQREEMIRKINKVADLGVDEKAVTEFVIRPIKVVKTEQSELDKVFFDQEKKYTKEFIEKNWWVSRTNEPYKNILKNEDWRKQINDEKDLIVHKVTDLDKIGLKKD